MKRKIIITNLRRNRTLKIALACKIKIKNIFFVLPKRDICIRFWILGVYWKKKSILRSILHYQYSLAGRRSVLAKYSHMASSCVLHVMYWPLQMYQPTFAIYIYRLLIFCWRFKHFYFLPICIPFMLRNAPKCSILWMCIRSVPTVIEFRAFPQ